MIDRWPVSVCQYVSPVNHDSNDEGGVVLRQYLPGLVRGGFHRDSVADFGKRVECGFVGFWKGVEVSFGGCKAGVAESFFDDLEVCAASEQP